MKVSCPAGPAQYGNYDDGISGIKQCTRWCGSKYYCGWGVLECDDKEIFFPLYVLADFSFVAALYRNRDRGADVALRVQENKMVQCTVVKTTWNTFCKPEALSLPINSILHSFVCI